MNVHLLLFNSAVCKQCTEPSCRNPTVQLKANGFVQGHLDPKSATIGDHEDEGISKLTSSFELEFGFDIWQKL